MYLFSNIHLLWINVDGMLCFVNNASTDRKILSRKELKIFIWGFINDYS